MTRAGRSWWIPLVATAALLGSGLWMVLQGAGASGSMASNGPASFSYGSMMSEHARCGSMMDEQGNGSMMDEQGTDSMMDEQGTDSMMDEQGNGSMMDR
ncbi:hypothetical protein [Cellulomonas fimi]|uniref:Uncharacterized protein n=1 Tax=Cellulomonas fimi TaxID=1708 RepID=A0A7Y0LYZ4_CELFI|nr:hypothetical protein [Cellulomonas fimi]NMR20496.1 hypothetical protein [Cellulomonas fimi]